MSLLTVLAQAGPVPDQLDTPEIIWSALLPLLFLSGGAILLLTVTSLVPSLARRGATAWLTAAVGVGTIVTCIPVWQRVQDPERGPISVVAGAIGIDGFSVLATGIIASVVVLSAMLLPGYMRREDMHGSEMYVLVLLSAAGGVIMASANDLIVMFIGLEALSISIYILAAMHVRRPESQEAGFKYFILGAFSSAFFLYGIALVYGATGSTNLIAITEFLTSRVLLNNGLLMMGIAMLLVGFGFKIAAVPFHSWTPDVYQGAPTPITGFMAAAVKVGAFGGLIRVFYLALDTYAVDWQPVIYALALLSMVVGASLAIVQTDVKRMLAYSSINHAGIVLVGLQAATGRGIEAMLFYLVAYAFMVVGSFAVVGLVTQQGDAASSLDDFKGLSRSRPALALALTVLLFAQAGIPGTSGFFGKFYVIGAAVEARSFWLALAVMVTSVISAVLYLKIIVAMYLSGDEGEVVVGPNVRVPRAAAFAVIITIAITIGAGVVPHVLVDVVRDATPVLVASPF